MLWFGVLTRILVCSGVALFCAFYVSPFGTSYCSKHRACFSAEIPEAIWKPDWNCQ